MDGVYLMEKSVKKILKIIITLFRKVGLLSLMRASNKLLRKFVADTHHLQMIIEWGVSPTPEWFDHFLDQYYYWRVSKNSLWLERGIFSAVGIKQSGRVLEICCGDGFNAYHFYSIKAKEVTCVDFDVRAIYHAEKGNYAPNINYKVCDIRHEIPNGGYDNIIWDAAIEHFTESEIDGIMQKILDRLNCNGLLSGYTIVEKSDGIKHLEQHEYEFKSKEDLMRFFTPYFENVKVFETIYPTRHNLYFYASNGPLPFDEDWEFQITCRDKVGNAI